ncbi:MAG: aminoacyl-tRNA hydrolase [Patescibacteria group bacterium]|nr:aminoacyl-tRNA hydrolase [Patescibacteria group bacterium]MCL5431876.1 aminoacyl-tRNA hydrolase [Patescibacteria group bacterium]
MAKLIIGLGNPGAKYSRNRHNVGHMFVDATQKSKLKSQNLNQKFKIIKTDVFMNDSGTFVKWAMGNGQWAINDLYIAHDDLDLPLGQYKIQFGVGPKVHNGVASVEDELGTKDFWRIRIGVDSRQPESRKAGKQFVLEDFTSEELETLKGVFDAIAKDRSFPH